jgi:hypothetical protein
MLGRRFNFDQFNAELFGYRIDALNRFNRRKRRPSEYGNASKAMGLDQLMEHERAVAASAPCDNAIKFPILAPQLCLVNQSFKHFKVGLLDDVFEKRGRITERALSLRIQRK